MTRKLFTLNLFVICILMLTSTVAFAGPNADTVDGKHATDLAAAVHNHSDLDSRIAALESLISSLQSQVAVLQNDLATVKSNAVLQLGPFVSVDNSPVDYAPGPNILITGANLHVRNGLSSYYSNGLGNLIVGYNIHNSIYEPVRTGSHNIIAGGNNNYAGLNGMAIGWWHHVSDGGVALAGSQNIAERGSVVAAGKFNTAGQDYSFIGGGGQNATIFDDVWYSAAGAAIVGGGYNTAIGNLSATLGGKSNLVSGEAATVTGGEGNIAGGARASVSGGLQRNAPGDFNWAAGSLLENQ